MYLIFGEKGQNIQTGENHDKLKRIGYKAFIIRKNSTECGFAITDVTN